MGYGILVQNGSSRTLIDSDQGFPTLYQVANTTVANGSAFPVTSDLIFAKPTATTGTPKLYKSNTDTFICSSGNLNYRQYRAVTGGGFTPSTTGYGLNIFNSSAACIFSATSSQFSANIDIIAIGLWGFFPNLTLDVAMPNSTYALSTGRIYVLVSTSMSGSYQGSDQFYEYLYSTGTYGTIRLTSQRYIPATEYVPGYYTFGGNNNTLAIAYVRD